MGNIYCESSRYFFTESLKICGVNFTSEGFCEIKSFEKAEASIRKLLYQHAHSEFLLDSRSIFLNTYFLSKFWYCATINEAQQRIN